MHIQSTIDDPIHVRGQDGLSIARGFVQGITSIHKFGNAPDFDSGDLEVDLWTGANDAGPNLMQYTYSTSPDINRLSSSIDTDTQDIEIQGLDKNYKFVIQTITLTGQTPAPLENDLYRVLRMRNMGATNLAGTVYCFVNVATTAGVPDTLANIRGMIPIGSNQTKAAIHTIPASSKGYLFSFFASLSGAKKEASYTIRLYARPYGGVFQLQHESSIANTMGFFHIPFYVPKVFEARTDIALRALTVTGGITESNIAGGFELIIADEGD